MAIDKAAELRAFKNQLAELSAQLQLDIQAKAAKLDPSPQAIAERRKRVLNGDFQFFSYTYCPHHIRGTPSKFQAQFCTRFPILLRNNGTKEWWVAPRGEAKSSLLTKIGPVWLALQRLLQRPEIRAEINWQGPPPRNITYALLLGAETSLPTKLLEVVKTELTHNAALALDFPELCGRGPVWKIGEIVTKTGLKLEPFGAEQAIRGTFFNGDRPQVLLADDIITDSEAKSPTERQNRWTWVTKAVEYLGPTDGSVIFLGVGTVLHNDDPISRAKKTIGHLVHHYRALEQLPTRMDLWNQCEEAMLNHDRLALEAAAAANTVISEEQLPSYRFYLANQPEMDRGAIISWPGVRTLYRLMRARAANPAAFKTEMQGDGKTDDEKVFGHITYWAQRSKDWLIIGACDPSMGQSKKGDPSSIIVGGVDRSSRVLHAMYEKSKQRVPSKLEDDLISAQTEFNCAYWGFENNNAYEWARGDLIKRARAKGVHLPLIGITATIAQALRIEAMEPDITDRLSPGILFHPSLLGLLNQLDTWPDPQPGHHYDSLVSLEILRTMALRLIGGPGMAKSIGKRQSAPANLRDFINM